MNYENRSFFFGLALFLWASSMFASLSERFVGDVNSVATVESISSLWHNPAGLGFLGGSESALGYLYEWGEFGNRHHGGMSLALNFLDVMSLGGGINSRISEANQGSDVTGIFGSSLRFGERLSFGISFLKSYYFKNEAAKDTKISFGFQARPASFFALGGLYQEIHEGYFKAPLLQAGIALRPWSENFTIGVDSRFSPHGIDWHDGFRVDPIFSLKGYMGGLGAGVSFEIPGIKDGWNNPNMFFSLELNFAHVGLNFNSHVVPQQKNYSAGAYVRSSSEEWRSIDKPSGLWVELTIDSNGNIEEKQSLWASLLGSEPSPLSVLALLKRIRDDASISGVMIHLNGFSVGDARAQEWRNALLALRQVDKQVIVYLDSPSERDYYIASVANKIFMNKHATISLHRFQANLTHVKDLLEKVGVKAEAIAAGSYKTAPRMWTHSKPNEHEIEVSSNIIKSFYESFLDQVSQSRNIDKAKLKDILDGGEISAQMALEYGLIDAAIHKDEHAKTLVGQESLPVWRNYGERQIRNTSWATTKKIVIIPIVGEIVDGRVIPSLLSILGTKTGAHDVIEVIEEAASDPDVAGIIVRINSVGGDANAGEKIHRALTKAQERVPVVASMSDVAASAGYMIAAGAQHIIAEPNTVTGSIGVFSLYFSGEKLAKKAGVNSSELAPIKNPGPTYARTMSALEREQAQKIVDWYYHNFISTVASSLDLDENTVKSNAEGHVWLGHEAFQKKLVHELGGFSEAIDAIRVLAEIKESESTALVIYKPGAHDHFALLPRFFSQFRSKIGEQEPLFSLFGPYMKALSLYRINGIPQARLPFDIDW